MLQLRGKRSAATATWQPGGILCTQDVIFDNGVALVFTGEKGINDKDSGLSSQECNLPDDTVSGGADMDLRI